MAGTLIFNDKREHFETKDNILLGCNNKSLEYLDVIGIVVHVVSGQLNA